MMKNHPENIRALTKSKEKFIAYAKKVEKNFNRPGPSGYFYQKVINEIRKTDNYSLLFDNINFVEDIYATLTAWGMHRMDQNTRMAEFEDFKSSITKNKEKFIKISQKKIRTANLEQLKNDILDIFSSLRVMGRDKAPKFVANSKIMHFLLPDLIPPMDKGHILYFFYGWNSKNKKERNIKRYPNTKGKEEIYFWEILKKFQEIANELDLNKNDLKNKWDTSIPKMIDNAIIGFNAS